MSKRVKATRSSSSDTDCLQSLPNDVQKAATDGFTNLSDSLATVPASSSTMTKNKRTTNRLLITDTTIIPPLPEVKSPELGKLPKKTKKVTVNDSSEVVSEVSKVPTGYIGIVKQSVSPVKLFKHADYMRLKYTVDGAVAYKKWSVTTKRPESETLELVKQFADGLGYDGSQVIKAC